MKIKRIIPSIAHPIPASCCIFIFFYKFFHFPIHTPWITFFTHFRTRFPLLNHLNCNFSEIFCKIHTSSCNGHPNQLLARPNQPMLRIGLPSAASFVLGKGLQPFQPAIIRVFLWSFLKKGRKNNEYVLGGGEISPSPLCAIALRAIHFPSGKVLGASLSFPLVVLANPPQPPLNLPHSSAA